MPKCFHFNITFVEMCFSVETKIIAYPIWPVKCLKSMAKSFSISPSLPPPVPRRQFDDKVAHDPVTFRGPLCDKKPYIHCGQMIRVTVGRTHSHRALPQILTPPPSGEKMAVNNLKNCLSVCVCLPAPQGGSRIDNWAWATFKALLWHNCMNKQAASMALSTGAERRWFFFSYRGSTSVVLCVRPFMRTRARLRTHVGLPVETLLHLPVSRRVETHTCVSFTGEGCGPRELACVCLCVCVCVRVRMCVCVCVLSHISIQLQELGIA